MYKHKINGIFFLAIKVHNKTYKQHSSAHKCVFWFALLETRVLTCTRHDGHVAIDEFGPTACRPPITKCIAKKFHLLGDSIGSLLVLMHWWKQTLPIHIIHEMYSDICRRLPGIPWVTICVVVYLLVSLGYIFIGNEPSSNNWYGGNEFCILVPGYGFTNISLPCILKLKLMLLAKQFYFG